MSETPQQRGRVNQKRRTRAAIIAACQELITGGAEINMPAVARAALVSEPTAYRYFPDLASLLEEALAGIEPDPAAALATAADPSDPVQRVAYAAELLARLVIERQGAIRALISVSITRGTAQHVRPGYRFALIDQALEPLSGHDGLDAGVLEQLRRDLAVVISAEAVLTLTDLYDLGSDAAVASVVHTARLITEATLSGAARMAVRPSARRSDSSPRRL
jgi:AcrR family transcriptional regulator